jgi:hypothetical protein
MPCPLRVGVTDQPSSILRGPQAESELVVLLETTFDPLAALRLAEWVRVELHVVRIGLDGVERRQVGQVTVVVTQPEAFGLEDRRHRSTVAGTGRARPPILPS